VTAEKNIPLVRPDNLFVADPLADAYWGHVVAPEHYAELRPRLHRMGEGAARAWQLAELADRNPPVLETHDDRGDRIDRVLYDQAHDRLEELSYGAGIVALKYDPDFMSRHGEHGHLAGFALGYYFAQTEMGVYCPVCMTDGVARILARHADGAIAKETVERLATTDPDRLWQGAMFLTERQGGSDVGANIVEARQEGDRWFLSGHKWFCSNVDADAVLVLARMPGGTDGTRGLGMFLLLRERPEGNAKHIVIERIKDKLGTRSIPTGEITLEDAEAHLVAGEGEGFRLMTEMLNLSRLYNAVASVAIMRRAVLEALAHGAEREAFKERLWDLPLWRTTMADLVAEQVGSFVSVFEVVRSLDRADAGEEEAKKLVRIMTPLAKGITGTQAIWCASEAMEAIGGNAYIESSPMPRLLRDAQVLPIWEGTTNILALDVMRSVRKERTHEALFARIDAAIEGGRTIAPDLAATVERRSKELARGLESAMAKDIGEGQREIKAWLEPAWRVLELSLLLENAKSPGLRHPFVAACRRLLARPLSTGRAGACVAPHLTPTEDTLLHAAYAG